MCRHPLGGFLSALDRADQYPFTVSDIVAISEVLGIDFLQLMEEADRRYRLAA